MGKEDDAYAFFYCVPYTVVMFSITGMSSYLADLFLGVEISSDITGDGPGAQTSKQQTQEEAKWDTFAASDPYYGIVDQPGQTAFVSMRHCYTSTSF